MQTSPENVRATNRLACTVRYCKTHFPCLPSRDSSATVGDYLNPFNIYLQLFDEPVSVHLGSEGAFFSSSKCQAGFKWNTLHIFIQLSEAKQTYATW
jgi:hypothetical protein